MDVGECRDAQLAAAGDRELILGEAEALLGPDVELRRTEYDYEATAALYRASGIPDAEQEVEMLLHPPTRAEIIAHAESVVFAG